MRSAREYADGLENDLRFGKDHGLDHLDIMIETITKIQSEAYEAGQREMQERAAECLGNFTLVNVMELPIKPYGEQT